MKPKLIKINQLILEQTFYPRMKEDWRTVFHYKQAMKAGSVFPPVVVGLFKGKKYLIDGWHRVKALKLLEETHVPAIIKKFDSEGEMFADAVRLNSTHGNPLSGWDRVRIVDKLKDYDFTLEQISKITKIPVDNIKRFEARVVTNPNGKKVYLKAAVAKALVDSGADLTEVAITQDSINVRSVEQLLTQLIELLENNLFPLSNNKIKELGTHAFYLLKEKMSLSLET